MTIQDSTESGKLSDEYTAEERKMLAGEECSGRGPYLTELRRQVREKVKILERDRDDPVKYAEAIRNVLGSTADDNAIIEPPVYFDYGRNTHVGKEFYMNAMCVILDSGRVDIGDNVMFGPGVQVYAVTHSVDPAARLSGLMFTRPVKIGNNVWVGGHAVILPGVT
ncbi:hypothetical protein EDC05_000589, partial [Coemansia umbellata]